MTRARAWSAVLAVVTMVAVPAGAQSARPSPNDPHLFRALARQQNPAVVSIAARRRADALSDEMQAWLTRFTGRPPRTARIERSAGSGFLISAAGEILTNDHVVADAFAIDVTLMGHVRPYRATIVGRDPLSDVALLRLDQPPDGLSFVRLGDSDTLEPGDWVMAIGNPFRLGHTVTAGIVSHVDRVFELENGSFQRMIQTDAAINVGSSGGPLFDVRGEVVGIAAATFDVEAGDNSGISFAIPINLIRPLLPQLRTGTVVRGRIGVHLHDEPLALDEAGALGLSDATGALITVVEADSAAARAGLRAGDFVRTVDGHTLRSPDDLLARLTSATAGCELSLGIVRHGAVMRIMVTVEALETNVDATPPALHPSDEVFGLTLSDRPPAPVRGSAPTGGVTVTTIEEDSAAWDAGVVEEDLLLRVNGAAVDSAAAAARELRRVRGTAPVFLSLWRDGDQVLVRMRRELP